MIQVDHSLFDGLETFAARAFGRRRDTPLTVRTLAVIVALLALTTGCSALHPAASPSDANEPDPWAGFNNGYAKNEKPPEKPAGVEEKTSKTETTSAALSTEPKSDKSDDAEKKPVAKKKAPKKKAGAAVAAKKPRKRAKKS